jgi:hypothetical protein
MHKCNENDLVELALTRRPLPAEIEKCGNCRDEIISLRDALRSTDAAMKLAQPADAFWSGYRARLRTRLEGYIPPREVYRGKANGRFAVNWRRLVSTSVPVPAPILALLFVVIIFSSFVAIRSARSASSGNGLTPPSIITNTVTVPTVQERVVTRVVYRNHKAREQKPVIVRRHDESPLTAQGLEGFKPADEVNLTIIKGSYHDEK